MSLIQNRAAVGPLHRHISLRPDDGAALPTVDSMVKTLRPEEPLHCIRPATISASAQAFCAAFTGDVLYAVKCNPDPAVLRALWDGGVRHFDCASSAGGPCWSATCSRCGHPLHAPGEVARRDP